MSAGPQDQKKPLPDAKALFEELTRERIAQLTQEAIKEAQAEARRERDPAKLRLFSEGLDASGQMKPDRLWEVYQARLQAEEPIQVERDAQLIRESALLAVLIEKYEKVDDLEDRYTDILIKRNKLFNSAKFPLIKDTKALFMAWTAVGVVCSLFLLVKGVGLFILGAGFVGIANSGLFLLVMGVTIPLVLFLSWKLVSSSFMGFDNTKNQKLMGELLSLTAEKKRLWQERLQKEMDLLKSRESGEVVLSEKDAAEIWSLLCLSYEELEKQEERLEKQYEQESKEYIKDQRPLTFLVVTHVISYLLVLGLGSLFLFKGVSTLIANGVFLSLAMSPFPPIVLGLLIVGIAIAEARYIYKRVANPYEQSDLVLKVAASSDQLRAASLKANRSTFTASPSPGGSSSTLSPGSAIKRLFEKTK